jgi:low affinity Fe/Cu permease
MAHVARSWFARFARKAASRAGHPAAFLVAALSIAAWAVAGPLFGFSDTWQLVLNTATSVITFLMVFLIQSTQSRDAEAMHIKLDELIRTIDGAHNSLLDLEELDEKDLERIRARYAQLAKQATDALRRGESAERAARPAAEATDSAR